MKKIIYTAAAAAAIIGGSLAAAAPAMAGTTPHITGSFSLAGPAQYETINNVSTAGGSLSYTNFTYADPGSGVWSLPSDGSSVALNFGLNGGVYSHHLTVDSIQPTSTTSFTFIGHGTYDADPGYTWTATGSVNGTNLAMHIVYTGTNAGYTADVTAVINTDGSISGKALDSNSQTLTLSTPERAAFETLDFTAPVNSGAIIDSTVTPATGQFSYVVPTSAPAGLAATVVTINVTDGGSPGVGHDTYAHGVLGQWSQTYPITSGNLTVH